MAAVSSLIPGPLSLRGLSDFNAYHQINANLVIFFPSARPGSAGQRRPLLNALIGGWHVSGIFAGQPASPSPSTTASPGLPTGTLKATLNRTGHRRRRPIQERHVNGVESARTFSPTQQRRKRLSVRSGRVNQECANTSSAMACSTSTRLSKDSVG